MNQMNINADFSSRLKRIDSRETYTVRRVEEMRTAKRRDKSVQKSDRNSGGGAYFFAKLLLVIVACLVGFRAVSSLTGNPDIEQRRSELAAGNIEGQIGAAILSISMIADPYLEPVLKNQFSTAFNELEELNTVSLSNSTVE